MPNCLRRSVSLALPSLVMALLLICSGCGRQGQQDRLDHSVSPALNFGTLQQTPFTKALTEDEIHLFQQIVAALPQRQPLLFTPLGDASSDPNASSPEQLIVATRQQYRTVLDPHRQAELWNQDPSLATAFKRLAIDAEALAMLQIRISIAWAAAALQDAEGHWSARAMRFLAEERLHELTQRWKLIEARPDRFDPTALVEVSGTIQEVVALSEFLGLLERVPAESFAIVEAHRHTLSQLLPQRVTGEQFERRLESSATVLPAQFLP